MRFTRVWGHEYVITSLLENVVSWKINEGSPPSEAHPHLPSFKATRYVCLGGALARPCTILVDVPPYGLNAMRLCHPMPLRVLSDAAAERLRPHCGKTAEILRLQSFRSISVVLLQSFRNLSAAAWGWGGRSGVA